MISIKLAIFDLDDTLVATRDSVLSARDAVLREFLELKASLELNGAQDAWQRLTWYYSADNRVAIFSALCRSLGRPEPSIAHCDSMAARYEEVMTEHLRMNSGAEFLLDGLRTKGIKAGIVTTGNGIRQKQKFDRLELSRWIPWERVTVDEPGSLSAKPQPTSLLKLCRQLNVEPSEAVVIGDRPTDVIAGNLAGCHTVLYYGCGLEVRLPGPSGMLNLEIPEQSIRELVRLTEILRGPREVNSGG